MTKKTMPTPKVELVSPPATQAIVTPATVGPSTRDRFMLAEERAIALKMKRSPTIAGMIDCRAGMDSDSTVPLSSPKAMKCQNWIAPL